MIRILACAAAAALLATTAPAQEGSGEPAKVGFIYVGPVGDFGWTYQHDQARQELEEEFGDRIETTFVESVQEGPDAERVIRQLASSGHDLIFTTSFGFMDPTMKVAQQFPEVMFEHATGYKRAENVATYMARFYEGRYIAGRIAGLMTETDEIGYVASFPIPEVIRGINAAMLGARSVNPDAKINVVWVNSWYDPGKEASAAKALIDQGADIIMQHTDSPAPLQVAENTEGVYAVGQASDMIEFAPNAQLTAIVDDWGPYYIERVRDLLEGDWQSTNTWEGLAEGMVEMAPYTNMPEDVKAEAEKTEQAIASGELHPFTGPVVDRAGETRIAEGETATDQQLLEMDWFVEGVEGDLPK